MNIDSATDFTLYYSTVQDLVFPVPSSCAGLEFSLSVREKLDWTQDSMCDASGTLDDAGNVVFSLDTFTQEFRRVCQISKFAWLEIYTETPTSKIVHLQRRIRIASRAATLNGQNPPDPVTLYYTKADLDRLIANLITIGSVTTGEPGSDASVTNSGTSQAAVLDFVIPRGNVGEPGPKGDTGNSGVYVGTEAPTDPAVNVWLDPSGDASPSGGGLSDTAAALLMAILKAGVYLSDQSADIAALEEALSAAPEPTPTPTPTPTPDPEPDPEPEEVSVSQEGTALIISNVSDITTVSKNGTVLTLS